MAILAILPIVSIMAKGVLLFACLLLVSATPQNSRSPNANAAKDKDPVPYTRKSIAQGKQFYLIHCVECHDQDGKGLGRRDFSGTPPADLTDPGLWTHGTSEKEIFTSTKEGTPE